jgi:DNA-binding MarR family transcriptional regulator
VAGDRRASLVSLTEEGRALFDRLHGIMLATEGALTDGLDPRDLDVVRKVLAHVAERARILRAERQA